MQQTWAKYEIYVTQNNSVEMYLYTILKLTWHQETLYDKNQCSLINIVQKESVLSFDLF